MFDISQLFISHAWAQVTDANAAPASPMGGLSDYVTPQMLMITAIFMVFYLLVIRPQQKKIDSQEKMLKALQRGDRVVTSGGIYGKVSRFDGDDVVMLEIADGVVIKTTRPYIASLEAKPNPVTPSTNDAGITASKS